MSEPNKLTFSTRITTFLSKIQRNWPSALTVSLVSLPLGIALSIASGAGPLPGVITGVWAGVVASIFGGSRFNIVGAAGALSTILYSFANFNGQEMVYTLPLLAIVTGLMILLVWMLKLDKYLIYVPSSVMYGFAAGVAVLIAFGQINDALGLEKVVPAHGFFEKLANSFQQIQTWSPVSFSIFVGSLALLILLKKVKFKIPGAIVVSVAGIALGFTSTRFNIGFEITTLLDKFGQINPSIVAIPDFSKLFNLITGDSDFLQRLFSVATVVASVGILETLIAARLGDKITNSKTDTRKEVFGLGLANMASGLMGGLPATGVFIRTGLNIKSGASDSTSAMLAGVFTGVLAIVFLPLFQYIPMAVISAILFNTAIGLIEVEKFERFWKKEKGSLAIALLVAFITVIEDASIGILIGVVFALLMFVDKLSRGEFEITFNSDKKVVEFEHGHDLLIPKQEVDVVVYSIEGVMVYIDAQSHLENLEKIINIPTLKTLILRMRDLFYVDIDGLDALAEVIISAKARGIEVLICSVAKDVEKAFRQNQLFLDMSDAGEIFTKTEDALCSIGFETCHLGVHKRKVISGKDVNRQPRLSKILNFYKKTPEV